MITIIINLFAPIIDRLAELFMLLAGLVIDKHNTRKRQK